MLNCDIDPTTCRCRVCGARVSRPHVRRNCGPVPPGLGDMAASALAAVGATKERVEAVVGGPCGCDERQEAMNEFGRKWLGIGNPSPTEAKDGKESSGVDR
jgi:hypothetical protein